MMKMKILVSLIISASLQACVVVDTALTPSWEWREKSNRKDIAQLRTGQPIEQVIGAMGAPDFNEIGHKEGQRVQVLYYRAHRVWDDGNTSKNECSPLLFVDGRLSGWGNEFVYAADVGM